MAKSKQELQRELLEGQDVEEPTKETPPEAEKPESEEQETTTEAPETPEETGEQTDEESPESSSPASFLDRIRELGYQGDDETAAQDALLDAYRRLSQERQSWQQRMQEAEELSRYGTEYLRQQREAQEKQQATEETETPESERHWWNPPKFDPQWLQQYQDVTIGEDGQPVLSWKKNTPRDVQQAAEDYQRYMEQWATNLVQRPQEVLPQIIEHEFNRLFEDRIRERDEETELTTFAERVREENRDWMYTTDQSGREVLTPQGQTMTRLLAKAAEDGIASPQAQWEYACAMYDYMNRAQEAQAQSVSQTAQQTAAERRRQQAARNAGRPNRTGTVPRPDEEPVRSQNPNLSAGRKLIEQLRQDGADFV